MAVRHTAAFKIDQRQSHIELIPSPKQTQNLKDYLDAMIIVASQPTSGRRFKLTSDLAAVRTISNGILKANKDEFLKLTEDAGKRLLLKEKEAQKGIEHLNKEIPKGVFISALLEENNGFKILLAKAEHLDFLEEELFVKKTGLPVDNKVYKSFLGEFNADGDLTKMYVFDTGRSKIAKYWYHDFLEVEEEVTDETNTEEAFSSIRKILNEVREEFPSDAVFLHNSIRGEFKTKEKKFELEKFINEKVERFVPKDEGFPVDKIAQKIRKAAERGHFDSSFMIKWKIIY